MQGRSDYTIRAFQGDVELWNFTTSALSSPFTSGMSMDEDVGIFPSWLTTSLSGDVVASDPLNDDVKAWTVSIDERETLNSFV